ncbi:transglycosylase SLT domain-containing protein [Methylomonas sp. LL1]|uniref:transglycosylase SLT domain-containing protein n=1 Tax=Methylomonas sp. LL1 TaxID=2785785 RepID=UPI001E537BAA|nr:transglycosylase SLT domain-containing protein [Methylomonas sp. LL1]
MMRIVIHLFLLVNCLAIGTGQAAPSEQSLSVMRKTFLQAEHYIEQDRESDFFALSDSLKNYPLYPYLQYQWLVKHLNDERAILAFMHEYPQSRYTQLLHRKWLSDLGRNQQWLTYIQHYKSGQDAESQCYFALARYSVGEQQAALESAKQLWLNGKSQPTACDALFETLKNSSLFSDDLVWQRFQAALVQNDTRLAGQMLGLMPKQHRAMAEIWLKLHHQPQGVTESSAWKNTYPRAGELFTHAIQRWLEQNPQAALEAWEQRKQYFSIPAETVADIEKRLAMALAFRRDSRAYPRLSQYAGQDESALEWRVRSALNQQSWPEVLTSIAALNEKQRAEDKWQYWQARALAAGGQIQPAQAIFQEIARHRSFYACLAAERLQQAIQLNHRPLDVTGPEIERLAQDSEFEAVGELLAIGRKPEASRQWWHAIAELDDHQLAVAAKLAQQWNWPSMAIFTIAKANQWDDMDLRFPLAFISQIQHNANQQNLDPALIFALIRQESAFDEFAGSSAGAVGLMQLMPKTAQQIAGEFNENWSNDFNLLNPDINLRFGSFYFKKVLNQFDGNVVLAAAAYNAGVNRVKQWLPKTQSLPADIWIETIPYKETRGYVSSVILYTLIYQQRLLGNRLKVADLLKEVKPG